MKVYQRGN